MSWIYAVMLYITAPWCEPCHLMEKTTFADPEVVEAINCGLIPIIGRCGQAA